VRPPAAPLPPGVVAFTSDSRHLPPDAAARRVRDLAGALGHLDGAVWYKKIDSTLRGNIGAELDALLGALDRSCAVVCPAFPSQRRGLHDGYLVCEPPTSDPPHLPALLARQSRHQVAAIPLGAVRAGAEHLAALLAAHAEAARLLVIDGLTDADLRSILDATSRALPGALLCGSAGLVGALAATWPTPSTRDAEASAPAQLTGAGPALLVVGSGSAAARRQVAHLRRHWPVEAIEIADAEVSSFLDTCSPAPGSRWPDILLHQPEPPPRAALDGADARARAAALAEAAHAVIARVGPRLLVLVGGDTAIHVLDRLGVERLAVLRELLPGIPLARCVGDGPAPLVVLKPGGFGDEDVLGTLLSQF
jgi:uncharacterized protein YgbK (DUF1537 family)